MHINRQDLTWQIAFTYMGAIVGAGFASGQELLKFFVVFGVQGLAGTLFAGLMFAFLGWLILKTVVRERMQDYHHYLTYLFGKKISFWVDIILGLYLCLGLAVMLVASGSLFRELYGWPLWGGFTLTAVIVYIALLMGAEGILWLNTALIPGLILMGLGVSGVYISRSGLEVEALRSGVNLVGDNWLLATLLYVAYNLVTGVVILSSLGHTASAGGTKGVILGGLGLGIMAGVMSLALSLAGGIIADQDIPMLILASRLHPAAGWVYSLALWFALLTTALCDGYGLLQRLRTIFPYPRYITAFLILLPTIPFIGWRFANVVGIVYPLLGYLGLVLLTAIIYRGLSWRKITGKRR
jgi:uncharacterized membrane protein YkvI